MDELFKNLPEIISRAAGSPLGILALTIIALSLLAFFFFRQATERSRILIFAMLLLGVAALAGAVIGQTRVAGQASDEKPGGEHATGTPRPGARELVVPAELEVPSEGLRLGEEGTYQILSARLDRHSDTELSLRFDYRFTALDHQAFVGDAFRLLVDDIPRAPSDDPTMMVDRFSARESYVVFVFAEQAQRVMLQIGLPSRPEGTRTVPIDLTARR